MALLPVGTPKANTTIPYQEPPRHDTGDYKPPKKSLEPQPSRKVSNLVPNLVKNNAERKEVSLLLKGHTELTGLQINQVKSALEKSFLEAGFIIKNIFKNEQLALSQIKTNGWVEEQNIHNYVDYITVAEVDISFRNAEQNGRKVCTVLLNLRAINTHTRATNSSSDYFNGNGKTEDQALSTSLGQIRRHRFKLTTDEEGNT